MSNYGIVLLCGLPAAGKSSLAKHLEAEKFSCKSKAGNDDQMAFIILNYDTFITEDLDVSDDKCKGKSLWKEHRNSVLKGFKHVLQQIVPIAEENDIRDLGCEHQDISYRCCLCEITNQVKSFLLSSVERCRQLLFEKFVFIIDDNMFYRSMRYQYFQLAREFSTGFCELAIEIDIQDALERNKQRCQPISSSSIMKMHNTIEFPDVSSNPWEKLSLVIPAVNACTPETYKSVVNLVSKAMENPEMPIETTTEIESRIICLESLLHQADQIIRKEIGRQIKEQKLRKSNSTNLSEIANNLNRQRKASLEKLKSNLSTNSKLNLLFEEYLQRQLPNANAQSSYLKTEDISGIINDLPVSTFDQEIITLFMEVEGSKDILL